MSLSDMSADLETAARECAGNWQKFTDFGWHDQPEDGENWWLFYTHGRDTSDAVSLSNAEVIEEVLGEFGDDVQSEHHGHWGCGWIDGYAVRVFRNGKVTDAFKAMHEIAMSLSDYPVLDESKMSEKESELQDKAWDNWASSEFDRAIESALENAVTERLEANGVPEAEWDAKVEAVTEAYGEIGKRELFDDTADAANVYWEDCSDGMSIDVGRVIKALDVDGLLAGLDFDEPFFHSRPVCWFDPRQMYLTFVV